MWRGSQAAWQDLTHVIRTVCAGRTYKPDISERWVALKRVEENFKGKNLNKDGSTIISPIYNLYIYTCIYIPL